MNLQKQVRNKTDSVILLTLCLARIRLRDGTEPDLDIYIHHLDDELLLKQLLLFNFFHLVHIISLKFFLCILLTVRV